MRSTRISSGAGADPGRIGIAGRLEDSFLLWCSVAVSFRLTDVRSLAVEIGPVPGCQLPGDANVFLGPPIEA